MSFVNIFTVIVILIVSTVDTHDVFALANWPTPSEDVKTAIGEMLEEGIWAPLPLPAYTNSGSLILPTDYEDRLKGALVRAKVSVSHLYLQSSKTDNYFADIRELWVLRKPVKPVVSPGKRKLKDDVKIANKKLRK